MSLFVLDTDILTLFERGDAVVAANQNQPNGERNVNQALGEQ